MELAALGELAGRVAHQVLNPLNILSLRLQLLGRQQSLDEKTKSTLEICENQISRIHEIIETLRPLSKRERQKPAPSNLNNIVQETLELASCLFTENNPRIKANYDPDLPSVLLDRPAIQRAFLYIFLNALQAVSEKKPGTLAVSTRSDPENECVRVVVSHTGTYPESSDIGRIFKLLFANEEQGNQQSLELLAAFKLVKDHGGEIWAKKNSGQGHTLTLEFPTAPNSPQEP